MAPRNHIDVSHDQTTVTLTIEQEDGSVMRVQLDAASTDSLLSALGHARGNIQPIVGLHPPEHPMEAIVDPAWRVPALRPAEGRVLALRHPCFGWLGFAFPDHEAANVADWLTRDIPTGPDPRGSFN